MPIISSPSSWVDCSVKVEASELPPGTVINSNGAGDAFTAGLVVSAMLRHTGFITPANDDRALTKPLLSDNNTTILTTSSLNDTTTVVITPYILYVQEKCLMLKDTFENKKDFFAKCHDMWENESKEVKEVFKRRCNDEIGGTSAGVDCSNNNSISSTSVGILPQSFNDNYEGKGEHYERERENNSEAMISKNMLLANSSLNLETAAQFASLVAANHVSIKTRDLLYLDITSLLERSMSPRAGLVEV